MKGYHSALRGQKSFTKFESDILVGRDRSYIFERFECATRAA